VHVEPATFLISSIKRTQDQKAWLIRGYNLSGDDINVNFQLLKKTKRAELVNLAEESLVKLKLDKAGTFSIPAKPHEIVTIKFID
jgi:alpha-mannosidase